MVNKMKINKLIIVTVTMLLTSVSFAQKGELLITVKKVGNNIDVIYELLNEENIFGLQFDIALPKSQTKSLATSSCTSSVGKSQLSGCSVIGNRLRVAILDDSLSDIKTGEVGRVTLKNVGDTLMNKLIVSNAKIYDKNANKTNITAIVDYRNITVLDEDNGFTRPPTNLLDK